MLCCLLDMIAKKSLSVTVWDSRVRSIQHLSDNAAYATKIIKQIILSGI